MGPDPRFVVVCGDCKTREIGVALGKARQCHRRRFPRSCPPLSERPAVCVFFFISAGLCGVPGEQGSVLPGEKSVKGGDGSGMLGERK